MKTFLAISINILLLGLTFLFMDYVYVAVLIGVSLIIRFFYFLSKRQNLVKNRIDQKIREEKLLLPIEHIMFRAVESSGFSLVSGMGYIALIES